MAIVAKRHKPRDRQLLEPSRSAEASSLNKANGSILATRSSSPSRSLPSHAPSPVEPIDVLKAAWKPFKQDSKRTAASEVSLQESRGAGRTGISRGGVGHGDEGWRLNKGKWMHGASGAHGSVRPLTHRALAEHDARECTHDSFCRCEACFGSLALPNPGSELKFSNCKKVKDLSSFQVALQTGVDKTSERSWTKSLGPTEAFVRKQTLPTRHALTARPAPVMRSSLPLPVVMENLESSVTINDLPRAEFESWETKWGRELQFIAMQERRNIEASQRSRPRTGNSTLSHASRRSQGSAFSARGAAYMPRVYQQKEGRRDSVENWTKYNAAFAKLEDTIMRGHVSALRADDLPWPPRGNVCGFSTQDSPVERKQKLRKALKRWHPDKWHRILEVSSERGVLATRLADITQQILRERDMA
eukprot:TRINITY_DN28329_c0_g1_i1.p1 TRINITY_DN28329_c0_g1~~TRINITY_DN28329_c0_g1_i1.p1  ORF type:complete len:418 (-),score=29.34 TRINITY_DN28329_c0_g1_i1:226-1479(-)